MSQDTENILLVVNADDFAYLPGVSRGIIEAHENGILTATGVMANTEYFSRDIELLNEVPDLDVGVHLNVTHGPRLTSPPKGAPESFRDRSSFLRSYLKGSLTPLDVEAEWRAQIERCLENGLQLWFLNSHEHVHMIPALFRTLLKLADEYGISHVRVPGGRLAGALRPGRIARSVILNTLRMTNAKALSSPVAEFVGLNESGQLSEHNLQNILDSLRPGHVYELMCHPGTAAARTECREPAILAYHNWELELRALCAKSIRHSCEIKGIGLVRYRDLPTKNRDNVAITNKATN